MILRLAMAGFLCVAAWAQAPQPPPRVIGTVEKLAGDHLQLRSGSRIFTFHIDRRTEVHKARTYRGLSRLSLGEEVSVRWRSDRSGRLVAESIWAEIVTFRATIHSVAPYSFDIFIERDRDPDAYGAGYDRVFVYPQTGFSTSARDLKEGGDVLVVGLNVGGGNVDALRVAIYNTDIAPMR